MSCVEDEVDTRESLRNLSRWLGARRWDVGIRDQTNFHDSSRVRIELLLCIGFKPCEPWLCNTLVVPQEFEPRLLGQLLVKVPVADVQILDCLKACPYVGQHVLCRNKIHLDVARFPERSLGGGEAIRAATDQESHILSPPDHLDGDPSGGVTKLERAVYVEANEECQTLNPSLPWGWPL